MRARCVLLVDDERYVIEAFRRALSSAPYEVELATVGEDALRRLERGPVDVIVCDENMPEMRGTDLLAAVRERFPRTVRVMMTGDSSLDSAVRAINDGGVFRFLRKPCEVRELDACIRDALALLPAEAHDGEAIEAFEEALRQLWLAAQPVVRPREERIVAYELLARSHSASLAHPETLFARAELLGRVAALEARVFELAARAARDLPPKAQLYVNLHPSTLGAPSLLEPLLPFASRVVLEITEGAALGDLGVAEARIAALRQRGFGIAVDDLGAGYAGLTHVARLRPDVVKFDIGLVQGVLDSSAHAGLVAAVTSACHELGIQVVGEGVETTACRDKLLELGCSLQQGYLFARPTVPFCPARWR